MNQLKDIYDLINAMTKTEKRYFRLFANQNIKNDNSNMLALFDSIARIKNISKINSLKTNTIKNLTVTKYQLRRLILKSLRAYHNKASKQIEIKNIIHNASLLYRMDLYEQCKKELLKAKKIAAKYELFSSLIEISSWDLKLATEVTGSNKFENEVSKIITEQKHYIDLQKNMIEYIGLSNRIFSHLIVHGIARNEKQVEDYRKLLNHPLARNENRALSFEAKRNYYNSHALYYVATNDQESAYLYFKKNFTLYSKNKYHIMNPIIKYAGLLNNLTFTSLETARYKEASKYIHQLKEIEKKHPELGVRIFEFTMDKSIVLRINGEGDESCEKYEKTAVTGLNKYKHKINQQYEYTIYVNLSILFFSTGDYKKSLYWINFLLNSNNSNIRHDVQVAARILNLIIHLELENTSLLPYTIRSTYRFFKEKIGLGDMEKIIYKYLNLILKAENIKNIELYKIMLDELLPFKKDPFNAATIENFLITWLTSKVEHSSFLEAKLKFSSR